MIGTQNKTDVAGAFDGPVDALFIKLRSEQVDAVRAAQVVKPVAVHVPDAGPIRFFDDRSDSEMTLNVRLILKRDTVGIHKGEIRDAGFEVIAQRDRFRKTLTKKISQPLEPLPALLLDIERGKIAREKCPSRIGIAGNPPGQLQSQPRVALKRTVFRARQQQPRADFSKKVNGQAGIAPS